jgi:hypothetical protein
MQAQRKPDIKFSEVYHQACHLSMNHLDGIEKGNGVVLKEGAAGTPSPGKKGRNSLRPYE